MMDKAPQKVLDRLAEIEAALDDLKPSSFGNVKVKDLNSGSLIDRRMRNRLHCAFLLLYHLQDDVKKLAKKCRLPKTAIDEFANQSLWVKLCIRAGNTHKHGLGGRSRNATLPNGLIYAVEVGPDEKPSSESKAIVMGMIVADADLGAFPSQKILEGALRDWGGFLNAKFSIDIASLVSRCYPASKGPTMSLKPDEHPVVPLGTTLIFELPEKTRNMAQEDSAKRRDES
jgi:hypothetical protein